MEPTDLRVLSQNDNTFGLPNTPPFQMFIIEHLNHKVRDWYNGTLIPTAQFQQEPWSAIVQAFPGATAGLS